MQQDKETDNSVQNQRRETFRKALTASTSTHNC